MTTLIAVLLLLLQTPELPKIQLQPPAHESTKSILRGIRLYVQSPNGLAFRGHACPTSPLLAYTSAHVVDEETQIFGVPDQDPSRVIHFRVGKIDKDKDVAELSPADEPLTFWFQRGSVPLPGSPIIGIAVLPPNALSAPAFGRLYGRAEDGFYLSDLPISMGSSGSCVLDSEGRAWGITKGRVYWSAPFAPDYTHSTAAVHAPLP